MEKTKFKSNLVSTSSLTNQNINNVNLNFQKNHSSNQISYDHLNSKLQILSQYNSENKSKINILKTQIFKKRQSNNLSNLKTKILENIFSFLQNIELKIITKVNKQIRNKFIEIIKFKAINISTLFSSKYKKHFSISKCSITVDSNDKSLNSFLVIKAKLINIELIDKTCFINYNSKYNFDKDVLQNFFVFETFQNATQYYWICNELTSFHSNSLNKAYTQLIMGFIIGDLIEINLQLYGLKGFMMLSSNKSTCFKWKDIILKEIDNSTDNQSRICEIEAVVDKWNSVTDVTFLNSIRTSLNPVFVIKNVYHGEVGYKCYKIVLLASKIGHVNKLEGTFIKDLGITIKVFDKDKSVCNEVKKNYLMYDRRNELQCRVGDIVILYITINN